MRANTRRIWFYTIFILAAALQLRAFGIKKNIARMDDEDNNGTQGDNGAQDDDGGQADDGDQDDDVGRDDDGQNDVDQVDDGGQDDDDVDQADDGQVDDGGQADDDGQNDVGQADDGGQDDDVGRDDDGQNDVGQVDDGGQDYDVGQADDDGRAEDNGEVDIGDPIIIDNDGITGDNRFYLNPERVFNYVVEDAQAGFDLTKAEIEKFHLWQKGVIPYYIDTQSYDKVLRDKIRSNLVSISAQTGLRFTEYSAAPGDDVQRWVMFLNRRGQRDCQEYNVNDFSSKGMQAIRIGYDCFAHGGHIAAAVLALLGVHAQHNAPDRDCYVSVQRENIMPDKIKTFEKLADTDWLFHNVAYDYCSASHPTLHRHSLSGKETMTVVKKRNPPACVIGEAKGLSDTDVKKIKLLYNHLLQQHKRHKVKSECSKLFEKKGHNNLEPEDAKDIIAAKKPDRYLGTGNTQKPNCDQLDQLEEQHTEEQDKNNKDKEIPMQKLSNFDIDYDESAYDEDSER